MSRSKAQALIEGGLVSVNGVITEKSDFKVKVSDVLTVRGHGKFKIDYTNIHGKKDRYKILARKYN